MPPINIPTIEVCPEHSGISADIRTLKNSDEKQWEAIKNLQNRLPVWATIVLSILTFFLGAAFTYAHFAIEIAKLRANL
jgi:hypothetical protein